MIILFNSIFLNAWVSAYAFQNKWFFYISNNFLIFIVFSLLCHMHVFCRLLLQFCWTIKNVFKTLKTLSNPWKCLINFYELQKRLSKSSKRCQSLPNVSKFWQILKKRYSNISKSWKIFGLSLKTLENP